jgi:GT2 family glycosyltransferase
MSPADLPDDVARILARRAEARQARDWTQADALRDELRRLGWEPVDSPRGSTARPLPAEGAGAVGYARPEDLASLLDQPATLAASLVVVADDHPQDLERLRRGLASYPPTAAWELIVVANAPDQPPDPAGATVIPTTERLGWADAVNLGLRRSRGAVTLLLDTSLEPTGPWLDSLLPAFDDPAVGIAGPWGVTSADLRQFDEAPAGEVDAVEAYCLAIRREALRAVGGFDHRFRFYRNADLDLSFAVRAAGWRAVRTAPLPLQRHSHRGYASLPDEERDRLSRRNFYRFLKHWGDRRDLLLHPAGRDARGRPQRDR